MENIICSWCKKEIDPNSESTMKENSIEGTQYIHYICFEEKVKVIKQAIGIF